MSNKNNKRAKHINPKKTLLFGIFDKCNMTYYEQNK